MQCVPSIDCSSDPPSNPSRMRLLEGSSMEQVMELSAATPTCYLYQISISRYDSFRCWSSARRVSCTAYDFGSREHGSHFAPMRTPAGIHLRWLPASDLHRAICRSHLLPIPQIAISS